MQPGRVLRAQEIAALADPAAHNYDRISHPPSTYAHEKLKVEVRQPAAERFIVEHGLNEFLPGTRDDLGIIVQGGITNVLVRGLDGSVTTTSYNFGGATQVHYTSLNVASGATVDLFNYTGSTATTSICSSSSDSSRPSATTFAPSKPGVACWKLPS